MRWWEVKSLQKKWLWKICFRGYCKHKCVNSKNQCRMDEPWILAFVVIYIFECLDLLFYLQRNNNKIGIYIYVLFLPSLSFSIYACPLLFFLSLKSSVQEPLQWHSLLCSSACHVLLSHASKCHWSEFCRYLFSATPPPHPHQHLPYLYSQVLNGQ